MKRISLAAGLLLLGAFVVYAHGGGRFAGPADKAVQLVLLVPAAFLFALAFRGWGAPSGFIGRALTLGGEVRFTLLLPLVLAGMTAWIAFGPLEGIPKGGDEAAYLVQSRMYARGLAWAPEPVVSSPRDLFPFRHFIFDRGRWFVMYTPIHALLMAPFTRAGLNALMGPLQGALSLAGAYLLFRSLAGRATARLGVLIMAISPFFLFMASTHMAHNSELLFVTWALFFLVRAFQTDTKARYGVAGFLLGLSLCAKPYTLLPWVLSIGLVLFARLRVRALKALLFISLGASIPVAFFLWSNALYTGDPLSPAYNMARGGSLLGFGPDKAWFPEYGDHTHTPLRGLLNIAKQAGAGSTILLGWPFLSLVPPLLLLMNRAESKRWKALFLPILAVVPFMFIHYTAAIDYGPRHYYTTLPAFALLCALGMREAVRRWGNTAVLFIGALFHPDHFHGVHTGRDRPSERALADHRRNSLASGRGGCDTTGGSVHGGWRARLPQHHERASRDRPLPRWRHRFLCPPDPRGGHGRHGSGLSRQKPVPVPHGGRPGFHRTMDPGKGCGPDPRAGTPAALGAVEHR